MTNDMTPYESAKFKLPEMFKATVWVSNVTMFDDEEMVSVCLKSQHGVEGTQFNFYIDIEPDKVSGLIADLDEHNKTLWD